MWRVFSYHDNKFDHRLPLEKVKKTLREQKAVLWLDLENPSREEYKFLDELGFHMLAVEDCRDAGMRPKMEDYGEYLFFVFRGINYSSGMHALDTLGIKIFLSKNLLVTVHHKPSRTIEEVVERVACNHKLMEKTELLFYTVLDTLTDNIMPIITHVEDRLTDFQHCIFKTFSPSILEEIFELKKWVLRLRRFLEPQRDIIARMIDEKHELLPEYLHIYLRDILDHTYEVLEHLEIFEELFPDAMNSYLSQVTNRMNEVMKVMSIIATLMLPLSFITGIFGMNFSRMPLVHEGFTGFWTAIGLMAALFIGMLAYFREKDWF